MSWELPACNEERTPRLELASSEHHKHYITVTIASQQLLYQLASMYRVGQKTGLFLKVDNFVAVGGRNACDISKFSKFYLENEYIICMSVR